VFQITIFFLYVFAGLTFAASRLPRFSASSRLLLVLGTLFSITGLIWHSFILLAVITAGGGITLSLANTVSFIGLQLALIGLIGAAEPSLRGLSGAMLLLGAGAAAITSTQFLPSTGAASWQLQAHILISLFAYGLLTVGSIVAVFALVQDARLRARKLTDFNQLFAPLESNEKLLYGIAFAGFIVLLVGVFSGLTFVDNLFAQHLVHKTTLSIIALTLFGILIAGRHFAGWRGRKAVFLYLGGFVILCLAYFGSRVILEQILHRSWG
jgi:ABC-type uncharacterized transport system permease subunit